MDVFVRPNNPKYLTLQQKKRFSAFSLPNVQKLTDVLKQDGHGGSALHYEDGHIELMTFDPAGIKSATGNNGTFDLTNPDIRYSRADLKAAKAAHARISQNGVTSPDDLRDMLRVPGYSQWAQSTIVGDVGATKALRAELEKAFPGFDWKAPKLNDQGVITLYPDWEGASVDSIKRLAALADRYDVPVAVRGGASTNPRSRLFEAAGFVPYNGMTETADRLPETLFSLIRPAGGITDTTPLFSFAGEGNAARPPAFTKNTSPRAMAQTKALNNALVNYGLGVQWKDAYEAVILPDTLSGIREAFQTAFGRDVRAVAPTAPEFDIFNGVYIPSQPKTVFVNVQAKPGFIQIAGHELWHDLRRSRPDLIEWYRSVAEPYYKNFPH